MPTQPHLLLASSNVRRMQSNLAGLLSPTSATAIENALRENTSQLYLLGRNHFLFAKRQNNRNWRQKISRFYYGAYNVSRSIRLFTNGEYSTDLQDHKKIETLPKDFPNLATYTNQLVALREDRNLCDYEHTAKLDSLALDLQAAESLVQNFLTDAKTYLSARGISF